MSVVYKDHTSEPLRLSSVKVEHQFGYSPFLKVTVTPLSL